MMCCPIALMLETDWTAIRSMIFQTTAVAAGAFVVLVLLASHVRFRFLVQESAGEDGPEDAPEPFQRHLTRLISGSPVRAAPVCLVMVRPDLQGLSEPPADTARRVADDIRAQVRAGDRVQAFDDGRIGIVLQMAPADLDAVMNRVRAACEQAARRRSAGAPVHLQWQDGRAYFPDEALGAAAMIEAAVARLNGAPSPPSPGPDPEKAAARREERVEFLLRDRRFMAAGQRLITANRKADRPAAVLYMDVVQLEHYNIYYGRPAGDKILRGLAAVLVDELREGDVAGHDGGVFLAVLDADLAGGVTAAQRMIRRIKRETFLHESQVLRAAVRIGIAAQPDHGYLPRHILSNAYKALQSIKDQSGNIFQVYDASMARREEDHRFVDAL